MNLQFTNNPSVSIAEIQYIFKPVASTDSVWGAVPTGPSPFHVHLQRGEDYDLYLRYTFQPETTTHYTIIVKPYWWNSLIFRLILGLCILLLAGGGAFLSYRRRKLRQFAHQEEGTQKALLSLRSVQAQLNPHFIFNALTSIQGLVNTGDVDGANRYLSEFSLLMRHTLAEQDRILNRLGIELTSMETYLRLEQLRFHFRFSFHVDPGLRVDELEIPCLLLQPVIENAVKHGVSGLRENGYIMVSVHTDSPNLRIDIRDNGSGFRPGTQEGTVQEPGAKYGLRLTADRIRLLNQLHPETPIELTRADGSGTTFTFTFKNWLA